MSGADFSGLLKRRIGLDCASIGQAAVLRAVRLRMQAIGEKDEAGYWSYLQASEEEIRQLIEAVVVPETWFFRYPESLSALAQLALRRGGELRLLSLPCSTGEEPYSIAMALLDAGLPPSAFRIDAVDVSERALEQARIGRYGRNAFRGGEQAFRQRYFSSDGQLSRAVMDCVRFVHGNLFDAGLLSALPPYDFVFCRNLLIYFDSATQTRALAVLTRLVRRDGAIFVGPAEASLLTARGHPALPPSRAFAFAAAPSLAPPASAAPTATPGGIRRIDRNPTQHGYRRCAHQSRLEPVHGPLPAHAYFHFGTHRTPPESSALRRVRFSENTGNRGAARALMHRESLPTACGNSGLALRHTRFTYANSVPDDSTH